MNASYSRVQGMTQTEMILRAFSHEQHIHPHQTLANALEAARKSIGFCPDTAAQALGRLHLDPQRSIGRLRRTELTQLAQTLNRCWQQNSSDLSINRS